MKSLCLYDNAFDSQKTARGNFKGNRAAMYIVHKVKVCSRSA